MEDPQTWHVLLGKAIANPQERQRIADLLGVKPITLTRWSTQKSKPRLDNLRTLLNALPLYREDLLSLLTEDYPELLRDSPNFSSPLLNEIPSAFYSRILTTSTTSPPILRKSTICTLVLQQMLSHLDPQQDGLAILIMLCVTPHSNHKVRSLRTMFGRGNPPWENQLEYTLGFLGAESQAGHAVRAGHSIIVQSRGERNWLYPSQIFAIEESTVASPLLLADHTAGCLYLTSTQPQFFSQTHLDLIQAYVDLLVVAFETQDFYAFHSIELELMPPSPLQQPYLSQFQQRVARYMIRSARSQKPLTRQQAELHVWQTLEEELLSLALHTQSDKIQSSSSPKREEDL